MPLDAGALRQHFGAGLETNSLARTPRSALEPSTSLGDSLFPARRGPGPADSAAHDLAKRLDRGLTSAEATVGGSHASQARASPEKGSGGKAAQRYSR